MSVTQWKWEIGTSGKLSAWYIMFFLLHTTRRLPSTTALPPMSLPRPPF
jgi:hypothetical protein